MMHALYFLCRTTIGRLPPIVISLICLFPALCQSADVMSIQAIIAIAESGVGCPYVWGGGCWDPENTGWGGADCSGYVTKCWQVPITSPVTEDYHPYSTLDFASSSAYWEHIERAHTSRGDALNWRSANQGHIFLFDEGDPWGDMVVYEARVDYGIVHRTRTAGPGYHTVRRNNTVDAAAIHRFAVSKGVASWEVDLLDDNIHRFIVAGVRSGVSREIASVIAQTGGRYEVSIEQEFEHYHLLEESKEGIVSIQDRVAPVYQIAPIPNVPIWEEKRIENILNTIKQPRHDVADKCINMTPGAVVVFAPDHFHYTLSTHYIPLRTAQGYNVTLLDPTDNMTLEPEQVRIGIKSTIAQLVQQGVTKFLLVGDANDYVQFSTPWPGFWVIRQNSYLSSGYPAGGQPERDIIPTWYQWVPHDSNPNTTMEYNAPYLYSDQYYIDLDNDLIPDEGLAIARIPAGTNEELLAYMAKLHIYESFICNLNSPTSVRLGFLAGNVDHHGPGSGGLYEMMATNIVNYAQSVSAIHIHHETDAPTQGLLNQLVIDSWNYEAWNVLGIIGGWSTRYRPGFFLDITSSEYPFDVELLRCAVDINDGHFPFMVAQTCNVADFARTEHPQFGMSVAERLLMHPTKGVIAILGPTVGTMRGGNEMIGKTIINEVTATSEIPVATRIFQRLREVMLQEEPGSPTFRMAQSKVLLMDVCHRLPDLMPDPVSVDPDGPDSITSDVPTHLAIHTVAPNPFNPRTTVWLDLPRPGTVTVGVHDLRGRLVRTLWQGTMDAGRHPVMWDGLDDGGRQSASGVYLVRMVTADGEQRTAKITLAK